MENHTAKHFVLQLGSLLTLYLSIAFLLVLLFNIINLVYPDSADSYWQVEGYGDSVRLGVAMLIVFFPTYLILTRKVNKLRRSESSGAYLGLTKWLVYLSLLIGGGVLLGDLVAVILSFLNGDLTARFVLKAGILFVVVGMPFYYYIKDARGYWTNHERASVIFGGIMSVLVLVSLGVGMMNTKTPNEVREMKVDAKQIQDLQDIQWRIEDYLRNNNSLPESMEGLYAEGIEERSAPENREPYEYIVTESGFELCATFIHSTGPSATSVARPLYPNDGTLIKNPHNWEHGKGRVCFERLIKEK